MPPPSRKPADVSAANKERNEYIPSFIAKKPFYVDDQSSDADYLEHQRLQKSSTDSQSKWYDRGRKAAPAATKYRKGACENCGAMTHKTKECLSRPRKLGAKWTGKDIQADEVIQDVQLGWEAKRDRWNGYDATEYEDVVKEYNELEELKRLAKEKAGGSDEDGADDDADDQAVDKDEGAKYEEEADMGRQQSTSTRNLRIREDRAKYLLNLDLDSAKYDPKTRSMVDSGATSDNAAALVAEEGFVRKSGDAAEFERAQRYAWESQQRGDKNKVHLQANPTSGEFLRKKEQEEADAKRQAHRKALLEKYGGEEHMQAAPPHDVAVTESERYVEYDERGGIKGAPKTKAKSKYSEDVFNNNHTSVWGSWWSDFKWGYACCHSTVKNSYCTGEAGKQAFEESNRLRTAADVERGTNMEVVVKDEEPPVKTAGPSHQEQKKRTFQEMQMGVTEEEMDEYRKKRTAANDPMANMLSKSEVLH
ncbi:putative mRNA splicing protein [Lineolata rhizophorae]|uniref:Pre-mRNA-splicing factor SLU7 n=1 Tax=Lineolata rhizophorae TaxID=578093 RepID=A0A6A6P9H3_9PEZI|nr:putative mRNA splicing protein [Lineolata rhizophorae]